MTEIIKLSKNFKKITAVSDVSFCFENKIYGLLGPNGAGKTTLLRCIAGLYDYDGKIVCNKKELLKKKEGQIRIGYLPQKFGMLPTLTVTEMMEFFCIQKNIKPEKKMIEECIESVGLEEKARSKISALSGGMVRRLGIAQTLLGNPEIIIFDEPTAGLDPEERLRFKGIVNSLKGKCTVILSTHIVSDVSSLCDEILVMNQSKLIFSGNQSQIKAAAKNKIFVLPEAEKETLSQPYAVIESYVNSNEIPMLRVACAIDCEKEKSEPKIEDGYVCLINDI